MTHDDGTVDDGDMVVVIEISIAPIVLCTSHGVDCSYERKQQISPIETDALPILGLSGRSPCRTASARGLVRLQAEEKWREAFEKTGLPVHVMRLGGIYGPGRSAMEAAAAALAAAGDSIGSSSKARRARQKYTSRVHVADICRVLEASMESPRPGAVYNIVDDEPAGRGEVVAFAKGLLQGMTLVRGPL